MIYRATISSALGLNLTGAFVAILFVGNWLLAHSPDGRLLAVGGGVLAWLVAIRVRYRVRVSPEGLASRTLWRESSVRWVEITAVRLAAQTGYWAGRFYGPYVVEFVSPGSRVRVNFKLYARGCSQEVMRRIPQGLKVEA
jgi:hypothetical protein